MKRKLGYLTDTKGLITRHRITWDENIMKDINSFISVYEDRIEVFINAIQLSTAENSTVIGTVNWYPPVRFAVNCVNASGYTFQIRFTEYGTVLSSANFSMLPSYPRITGSVILYHEE